MKSYNLVRRRIKIPETRTKMERLQRPEDRLHAALRVRRLAARDVREDVRGAREAGRAGVHPRPALQRRRAARPGHQRDRRLPDRRRRVAPRACTRPRRCSRTEGRSATDKPMVVLVNGYSRQRLGDRHRRPEGPRARRRSSARARSARAWSRRIVPLGDGATLKLTTAVYLTPNGTDINHKGITPGHRGQGRSQDQARRAAPGRPHVPHRAEVGGVAAPREAALGRRCGRPGGPRPGVATGRAVARRGAPRRPRPTPPGRSRTASRAGASSGRSSRCSPTRAPVWWRKGGEHPAPRRHRAGRARRTATAAASSRCWAAPTTWPPCCAPCCTPRACRRGSATRCWTRRGRRGRARRARDADRRDLDRTADLHHRPRHGARLRRRHLRAARGRRVSRARAHRRRVVLRATTTARSSARRGGARPACTCRCSPSPCCPRRSRQRPVQPDAA